MPRLLTRVIRRVGSDAIHVALVPAGQFEIGHIAGRNYMGVTAPIATECGAVLRSPGPAVCMRAGTKVNCANCRRKSGVVEAADDNTHSDSGALKGTQS